VDDGLPETIVTSVAQFPDGYIWLTTPRHVVRFDGVEFLPCPLNRIPQPLQIQVSSFTCVFWALTCLQIGARTPSALV